MSFWYQNGVCSNNRHSHRRKYSKARRGAGALAILCTFGTVVRAQDVPPGFVARFDITQRLEYSDNPDLDVDEDADLFGRTILNFGLESVTNIQRFDLNLGTDIEEWRDNRSSLNFTNSFVRLGYDRTTRSAFLGLDAEYRESDNTNFSDEEFDQDGNVINQSGGTREFYSFGLEGAVGREAPVGANFAWRYSEVNYSDTNDPNQDDNSTNDFFGQVNFRIDPRITANLTAKYIDYNAAGNGVDRETTGFGAGVVLEVSPILTTAISLSYDNIDRSGRESGTDDGITGSIEIIRTMSNGTLEFSFASEVESNDNGRRSFLAVSRDMDLPRGALYYSLGLTGAGSTIGLDPLADLNYTHIRPTQQIRVGLSTKYNVDNRNEEQLNTTLRASYNQQINNTSSFGVSASFFDRNELGNNPNDGQRFDIGVSYRHDLTPDWDLVGEYSHTFSTEDDGEDRTRNTIFVGLQRSFNWNP